MKIYKITEASAYIGVSINSLKTLANNGKIKSFSTTGKHRRFRQEDLDSYMGVEKVKQEKLTMIYARCSTAKQKENLERQKDRLRKYAESKVGYMDFMEYLERGYGLYWLPLGDDMVARHVPRWRLLKWARNRYR